MVSTINENLIFVVGTVTSHWRLSIRRVLGAGWHFKAVVLTLHRSCLALCWALVSQSCPTLCDPMHCSPPGSAVLGTLQARILQWVACPFARGSSWPRNQTGISCIVGWFFTSWATHNYLKDLLKHITGPHPQSFWLSRSGEEPENLHFNKFSGGAADLRTPLAELPI